MKVSVEVVAPVFAWSWDPRCEMKVYKENTVKDYSYITNCNKHDHADYIRKQKEEVEEEKRIAAVNENSISKIYTEEERLQRQKARRVRERNHIPNPMPVQHPSLSPPTTTVPSAHDEEDDEMGDDYEDEDGDQDRDQNDGLDNASDGLEDQFDYDDDENNVCGICRANYNGTCPTCKIPGDSCPLVIGRCKHYFHYHCIIRWLKTPHSKCLCPMCRRRFDLKRYYLINDPARKNFFDIMSKEAEKLIDASEDLGFWVDYRNILEDTSENIDELIKQHLDQVVPVKEVLHVRPKRIKSPWNRKKLQQQAKETIESKPVHSESSSSDNDDDEEELNEEDKELLATLRTDKKFEAKRINRRVMKLYKRERQLIGDSSRGYNDSAHSSNNISEDGNSSINIFHSKQDPSKYFHLRRSSISSSSDEPLEWTSHDNLSGGNSTF